MSRHFRIGIAFAVCAILPACKDRVEKPEPVRLVMSTIAPSAGIKNFVIVGTVQPQIKTDFSFRILGRLIARPVNVGDTVGEGELLAAIDPATLQLAVRSAVAELSNGSARSTNASGAEYRQRTLLATDTTTKAVFDSAEQARDAAQSTVVRAQASLTKAREQLGYAELKADFGGVVTAIGAEIGQVVSPGQAVVTIARTDAREAVVDVADDLAGALRIGSPLVVSPQLDPSIHVEGKIREIAPQADAATRTRRVRIALDDPPETFRLGTTITTAIASGPDRGFVLPSSAILTKDGKTKVWLVDASTSSVISREVQYAPDGEGGVNVVHGLEPGSRVVTAGVNRLVEGQKVRIDQKGTP